MCHPELIDLGRKLISACRGQGLIIGIGECYRTVEEQNSLYEKGRSKPGKMCYSTLNGDLRQFTSPMGNGV